MRRMTIVILAALVVCAVAVDTVAREEKGVEFPETVTIEGTECALNGIGIRKKLFISVYLGGLYLERPSTSAAEIISSDQTKRMHIHFLYKEVSVEQIVEAWDEGFKKNAPEAATRLRDKITRFNGFFREPMRKGDTMMMTYIPGKGTEVRVKGRVQGVIEGTDFMQALFSIWFGPEPPSDGLKEGMLGD